MCSHEERQEILRNIDLAKVIGLLSFLDIRKVLCKTNGNIQPFRLNEMFNPTILSRDRNMGIKLNGSIKIIEPTEK